ncbi:hypothetical protein [Clostridium sp. UBA1652]|nr:hypothetical protein [Clostridium sp. UBA1652]
MKRKIKVSIVELSKEGKKEFNRRASEVFAEVLIKKFGQEAVRQALKELN